MIFVYVKENSFISKRDICKLIFGVNNIYFQKLHENYTNIHCRIGIRKQVKLILIRLPHYVKKCIQERDIDLMETNCYNKARLLPFPLGVSQ